MRAHRLAADDPLPSRYGSDRRFLARCIGLMVSGLLLCSCAGEDFVTVHVVRVEDGDTLRLSNGEQLRLWGVDAPEWSRYGGRECGGDDALAFLRRIVEARAVQIKSPVLKDEAGRSLANAYIDGKLLSAELVRRGLACVYRPVVRRELRLNPFQQLLVELEAQARAEGRGLWGRCGECHKPVRPTAFDRPSPG